ncbi:MAG: GLPGLI family protein [Urechidicola sp.]|nr:GLPGLI family protein [Urechidicola sp.]
MKLILLTLLFPVFIFAQIPKGTVHYGFIESLGMGAPIGIDYNTLLIFNNHKSLYTTQSDSLEGGYINEFKRIKTDDTTFVINKITNPYGFRYFIDTRKDSLFTRELGFSHVRSKIPKIDWKIQSETKKIGNYTCAKATAKFRGRDYTAWFTTEIPVPFGPWKLQGLPGLILEAYDTHKEIYFYFKNITYPSDTNIAISKPTFQDDGKIHKWITFDEYKKAVIEIFIERANYVRVMAESFDGESTTKKYDMSKSYLEVFDIDAYLKEQ